MNELPLAPVKRMIKDKTNLRVSNEAGASLKAHLETKGEQISTLAMKFAMAGKRKTISATDIENACKEIN